VHRLTAAARAASEQNLSQRIALQGPRDELRELADTFDTMLERLDRAFTIQRQFIANASHELRTPLPVMHAAIGPGRMVFPNGVVRVRGKVIAYPAGGDRGSPPDALPGEEFVFVKAPPAEREALLREDPSTFFVTPHYANAPGVIVRLSTVDPDALRELLVEAWRTVASKRLVKASEQRPVD
jgi:hypothetical protein